MRKILALTMVLVFAFLLAGCFGHKHVVGNGAQTGEEVSAKQWYVLWGLIPLGDPDTNAMAGGASDYEIKTKQSFIDIVIGIFTGIVTVYPRSVTVTK